MPGPFQETGPPNAIAHQQKVKVRLLAQEFRGDVDEVVVALESE